MHSSCIQGNAFENIVCQLLQQTILSRPQCVKYINLWVHDYGCCVGVIPTLINTWGYCRQWSHIASIFAGLCHRLSPQIAKFMGPTWGPSGTDRTQVGAMLAHEPCYLGPPNYHDNLICPFLYLFIINKVWILNICVWTTYITLHIYFWFIYIYIYINQLSCIWISTFHGKNHWNAYFK